MPADTSARRDPPGYVSALAGATAGLVAGAVVCPFDVVKTRMQVGGAAAARRGLADMVSSVYREAGFRGFYAGLSPLLVGYLPSWATYFYIYKRACAKTDPIKAAVLAGACSTLLTNPIWVVKTRMMAAGQQYASLARTVMKIYTKEGLRAFYSGLGAALLGLPHVAIHFPLYENLKRRWAPRRQWQGILLASVISKITASTATYPHEVIRSRAQMNSVDKRFRGVCQTVASLYREGGMKSFYAGLLANVCRAVPASAVTLLTFELVSQGIGTGQTDLPGALLVPEE